MIQIAMRNTNPVFAFNMQISDQEERLVVLCMSKKKHRTGASF